ncbi:MAG TPA: ankyrin repeat domain-containing protein [Blastocatellia bacterium]|nr:ankyrin repeat domain-containing protein [Blastocatellia bacterium]
MKRASANRLVRHPRALSIMGLLFSAILWYFFTHWPRYRDTHLLEACGEGNTRAVWWLAHLGANLYGPYYLGVSPLMYAVRGDHKEVVQVLLDAGDDPNNPENLTADGGPIVAAVKTGDSELVGILLKADATKARRDLDGKTAIDYAKEMHRPDIESLLTGASSH